MIEVIVTAIAGAYATAVAVAVTPFMFISDTVDAAIAAGVFSVINTLLNLYIVRLNRAHNRIAEDVSEKLAETKAIVDRRIDDEGHTPERRTN